MYIYIGFFYSQIYNSKTSNHEKKDAGPDAAVIQKAGAVLSTCAL